MQANKTGYFPHTVHMKKFLKRTALILLASVTLFTAAACGGETRSVEPEERNTQTPVDPDCPGCPVPPEDSRPVPTPYPNFKHRGGRGRALPAPPKPKHDELPKGENLTNEH